MTTEPEYTAEQQELIRIAKGIRPTTPFDHEDIRTWPPKLKDRLIAINKLAEQGVQHGMWPTLETLLAEPFDITAHARAHQPPVALSYFAVGERVEVLYKTAWISATVTRLDDKRLHVICDFDHGCELGWGLKLEENASNDYARVLSEIRKPFWS